MKHSALARTLILYVAVHVLTALPAVGAVKPEEARDCLRKAGRYLCDISLNGGYPSSYSLDHAERRRKGKQEKVTTNIRIHPPGTPSAGDAFLSAWRVTRDEMYLEGAVAAARALVWGQRKSGGWAHHADVSGLNPGRVNKHRPDGQSVFDDDMTQGPLLFLMKLDQAVDKKWLTKAIDHGMSLMMDAQFDNGAWPQRYPLRGGYADYYTFNDAAINDCIEVLLQAHRQYGKQRYLHALRAAGDFLIESQGDPPQAGWAQQYSHDMEPAWARGFEPPGICSLVTANNIRTLVKLHLYTEDERYLSPIPLAIKWLEYSKIDENRWARLYEVGSNRPLYGDRKDPNKKHFDYQKISKAERNSYAWRGSYGVPSVKEYYRKVKQLGAPQYRKNNPGAPRVALVVSDVAMKMPQQGSVGPEAVREIIEAQDEQGRWITDGEIQIATFVKNMNALCSYLQAAGERKP